MREPRRYQPQSDRPVRVFVPPPLEQLHEEYWSAEAVEVRRRFSAAVGVESIGAAFHIQDGFRIVCDAYVDGTTQCENVVGLAPLPLDHDGLCERCRRRGFPFPPRVNLDPSRVVYPGMAWAPPREAGRMEPEQTAIRGDAWENPADVERPADAREEWR